MPGSGETRIAKALGLKVPVYRLLSSTLAEGHDPCWVGAADPHFASLFPDPFGLELLCEHMAAEEAIERIQVEYEILPAYFTPEDAMAEGAILIHDDAPGNICHALDFDKGEDVDAALLSG